MDHTSFDNIPNSPEIGNIRNSSLVEPTHQDQVQNLQQVIENFQKPNLPNANVPEQIIICFDLCYDDENSLFRLADGTIFTPINMFKRIMDFFIHSKNAINKHTEFALIILKDSEPCWVQDFTKNIRDVINAIDYLTPEKSSTENFDFNKVFQLINRKVVVPEYKQRECILPPPYIVRMIVLYSRSNCVPLITPEDPYFSVLRRQYYFFIDILLSHDENCAQYNCDNIYDALQDLDDGYSYVYEVSKNATKIHDCIAKLLAHPLQRPLQKHTDYSFGSKYESNHSG